MLEERLGDKANAEMTQEALHEAKMLAEKLRFSDGLINDMQAGRINSMEAFDRAEKWARAEREQLYVDLFDMFSTGTIPAMLGERKMLDLKTKVAEVLYLGSRTPEQRFGNEVRGPRERARRGAA